MTFVDIRSKASWIDRDGPAYLNHVILTQHVYMRDDGMSLVWAIYVVETQPENFKIMYAALPNMNSSQHYNIHYHTKSFLSNALK